MKAALLVITAGLIGPFPRAHEPMSADRRLPILRADSSLQSDLQDKLMDKFHAMNAKREGIFHENITPIVAPYFPVGQPIADTRKLIADQHLGELVAFKGKPMPDEHAPFATKFHLMGEQYSQVEVVIHFDFDGDNDADLKLKSIHAYLRGTSM